MKYEKIEQAYNLLLKNVQTIQNQLGTNIYDAMIEQNLERISLDKGRMASCLPILAH